MKSLSLDFRDCDLRIGTFDWGLTDLYFVGITKWVRDLKGFDIWMYKNQKGYQVSKVLSFNVSYYLINLTGESWLWQTSSRWQRSLSACLCLAQSRNISDLRWSPPAAPGPVWAWARCTSPPGWSETRWSPSRCHWQRPWGGPYHQTQCRSVKDILIMFTLYSF